MHVWSLQTEFVIDVCGLAICRAWLSFASEMYRGIGGRRSLSAGNLRVSAQPGRNTVTLDVHAVNFEKMTALRKHRGGYASHLSRKRDELKSLLDRGASVDRLQKRIVQVRGSS